MLYYSTNLTAPRVSLWQAIQNGIAPDGGLYMPETLKNIPTAFFRNINEMTLPEIAYIVAMTLFGGEMSAESLKNIVYSTLDFDIPLVKVADNIYSLELYHGPTESFKDVGTRFMAGLMKHYSAGKKRPVDILVATTGETGRATVDAFGDIPNARIHIVAPRGGFSRAYEAPCRDNVRAKVDVIEVGGNYDSCYSLVKQALNDETLRSELQLTTSNTINIAAFLPQTFYYFYAYAQLMKNGIDCTGLTFAVPSGNIGNLVAGIISKRTGLPVKRFLATGLDVGDPVNYERISNLFNVPDCNADDNILYMKLSDSEITQAIGELYRDTGYIAEPCGASGYRALKQNLNPGETGVFLETTSPARQAAFIEPIVNKVIFDKYRHDRPSDCNYCKPVKIPPTLSALRKHLLSI